MPEAAVDEHSDPASGHGEVGRAPARELGMKPEAATSGVNRTTQSHLGLRVGLLAAGQVLTAISADPRLRHPTRLRRGEVTDGQAPRSLERMSALDLTELMNLERQGWDSLTRSQGGDFYGRLMTDDAVMVLVNGMVLDRDTITASLNDSPPWDAYELADERLVPVSEDVAALVYRATASRAGDGEPFVALMTSVYRLVDGESRLALYQQTAITH